MLGGGWGLYSERQGKVNLAQEPSSCTAVLKRWLGIQFQVQKNTYTYTVLQLPVLTVLGTRLNKLKT